MELKGIAASKGVATGPVFIYEPHTYDTPECYFEPGLEEQFIEKFEQVREKAKQELKALEQQLKTEDEEKAKIFFAHWQLLNDVELIRRVHQCIQEERKCTEYAISTVFNEYISLLQDIDDPTIAARSMDLSDVKNRLLRILSGQKEKNLSHLPEKVIVVAYDLLPSEAATLDRLNCLGIITEMGNTTSHTAMIARSYNLPAVLGLTNAVTLLQDGETVLLDATAGEVITNPPKDVVRERENRFLIQQKEQKCYEKEPCRMADGFKIELGINIGSKNDTKEQVYYDYVGLLRTEILFMERSKMPTEQEQFEEYVRILEQQEGKTVTLRTLDIGGDKSLPYYRLSKEDNPALGRRAIRFCFEETAFFLTQLRAALRASAYGAIQLLFPMVSSIDDIVLLKSFVETAKQQLRDENIKFNEQIKVGVMIEIPALALISDLVAKEVDFVSIGTNDLTQYLCAADRTEPEVASYYQMLSPAMLRLLSYIFVECHKQKKPVSVCGELAGEKDAAVLLVGLGARALSMSACNLSSIKETLAKLSLEQAKEIANACKSLDTEMEISNYLQKKLN